MAVVKPNNQKTCFIKLKVNGRWTRFTGVKDRALSKSIEARIRKLADAKAHYESIPVDVRDWLRDLPVRSPRLFEQLIAANLADEAVSHRRVLHD